MDAEHPVEVSASGQSYHGPSEPPPSQPQDTTSQIDADTCRICRGEGTAEEPLFYPCKCSGSIKHVHQDCLMEWLSHSQKKHCELCKTPFRFTKLYAPNMPQTVPVYVFISHMAKYIFRNMLVWARAGLVIMVWLVWLPYLMRRIWSALFWVSDEGISPLFGRSDTMNLFSRAVVPSDSGTCPASPLLQTPTTTAFSSLVTPVASGTTSQTTASLYGINITTDNPLSNMLFNLFLSSFYMGGISIRDNTSAMWQNVAAPVLSHHPSLLSDVRFLQRLSSASPALGGFVIDVVEGQIITIVVVICFILIILVRDYVVQQQPDINLRAAFAAADNAAPAEAAEPAPQGLIQQDPTAGLAGDDIDNLAGPEQEDDRTSAQEDDGISTQAVNGDRDEHDDAETSHSPTNEVGIQRPQPVKLRDSAEPADGANNADAEFLRGLPAAEKYVQIWREALGDPDLARAIARREMLEDELANYLDIGKAKASRDIADNPEDREVWRRNVEWAAEHTAPSGKGKAPAVDEALLDKTGPQAHSYRPRSATDGPQLVGGVNPLAHNNWAFSDPQEGPSTGPVPDVADRDRWGYITPPPSTMAESASSSQDGRTPSTSDPDEGAHNISRRLSEQTVLNIADSAPIDPPEDWEAAADLEEQTEQPQIIEDAAEGRIQQLPAVGIAQRVADFMWRDVEAIPAHELPPILDADDFFDQDADIVIPAAIEERFDEERDADVLAAAAAAGIDADAEAAEDAEDLEGVLELLGMRGPIAGLFQNALFCAFLVTITLVTGVFLPYNLGRLSVWLVANPVRPIRLVISLSKTVQDVAMLLLGGLTTVALICLRAVIAFFRPGVPQLDFITNVGQRSWSLMQNAGDSLRESGATEFWLISTDEVRNFSIVSHAALLSIKSQVSMVFSAIGNSLLFVFGGDYLNKASTVVGWTNLASTSVWEGLQNVPNLLSGSWVIDLGAPDTVTFLDPELASWGAMDRLWVIFGGYIAMCLIAGVYLGRGSPIAGRIGHEWEATIIELLVQASGVMKVILIIGIEMLVFPLYCGLLLDVALLPLFEDTTVMSRVMFTVNYPLTSVFVHWFVGTGYMFHFALFVSMCRKIMRKGVLCKYSLPATPYLTQCSH